MKPWFAPVAKAGFVVENRMTTHKFRSARLTDQKDQLAREIANLARGDGLVLFVGAGINGTAGLTWKELLQELLVRALGCSIEPIQKPGELHAIVEELAVGNDLYAQASMASVLLGEHRFLPILRSAIYSKFHGETTPFVPKKEKCTLCAQNLPQQAASPKKGSSPNLHALRQACNKLAASRPSSVNVAFQENPDQASHFGYLTSVARLCLRKEIIAVVTYNYDTLLEHAMGWIADKMNQKECASYRMPMPVSRQFIGKAAADALSKNKLHIYHVHGCIPPPHSLIHLADFPVVLAQQDYARSMQDPYSWENSCQLHFLRSHPCLFLGLSMTDWNMLRLLKSALAPDAESFNSGRLFCIDVEGGREGNRRSQIQAGLKIKLLDSFGVRFIPAQATDYTALREFTCQLYAELNKFK